MANNQAQDEWSQYKEKPTPTQDEWSQYKAQPPAIIPAQDPSTPYVTLPDVARFGGNVLQGIGEMPLEATTQIGRGIHAIGERIHPGLGERIVPSAGLQAEQIAATPQTPGQAIGKTGANIASFMIPGLGEEAGAALAGTRLARTAPIARMGINALQAGGINALQGGGFGTGAAVGAGGEILGAGMRAIAPGMAESASGIGMRQRGYGKTPGATMLEETRGLRPGTVERSTRARLDELNQNVDQMAAQHPGTIDLRPALGEIRGEISRAQVQNNQTMLDQLKGMRRSLTTEAGQKTAEGGPVPIAKDQPATRALELKRGLRKQYISNYDPSLMHGTRAVAARASNAIDQQLDAALGPEFTQANQRISSLIPIEEGMERAGRHAGVAQNVMHRIGAHTGALTAAMRGAAFGAGGYYEGGVPGAITGGIAGLVLPEILASPATRMAIARGLYSPLTPRIATGTALQIPRLGQ